MINFWSGQNTATLKHHKTDELMWSLIIGTGRLLHE